MPPILKVIVGFPCCLGKTPDEAFRIISDGSVYAPASDPIPPRPTAAFNLATMSEAGYLPPMMPLSMQTMELLNAWKIPHMVIVPRAGDLPLFNERIDRPTETQEPPGIRDMILFLSRDHARSWYRYAVNLCEVSPYAYRYDMESNTLSAKELTSVLNMTPTSMATALRNTTDWPTLVAAHMVHDSVYHTDIFNMANPDKVKHYALHFAKYMGRVVANESDETVVRSLVDTIAIILGFAWALRLRLNRLSDYKTLKDWVWCYVTQSAGVSGEYLAIMGDRYDHLESGATAPDDSRSKMVEHLSNLLSVALTGLVDKGIVNPIAFYHQRIAEVQKKHIAYEHLRGIYHNRMAEINLRNT